MCGITGYVGARPAVSTAIASLKRLEYRGYDSAGVAYPDGDGIGVLRAEGRIVNLEALVGADRRGSHVAVAHTRWATHGSPNERNAHPHRDCRGDLAVVHNGIVENYVELREMLRGKGHEFASETDTEVLAHLIEENLPGESPSSASFVEGALAALAAVRGSYALAVVSRYLGDAVFVARKDSPLIVGLGEGENFIASDITAVMAHTRRVVILEDGDCALVAPSAVTVFGLDGLARARQAVEVTWNQEAAERGGFAHFMLKEIHDEPRSVRDTLRGRLSDEGRVVLPDIGISADQWSGLRRICIVGCGTAYHAGLVGKRMLEQVLRRPVDVAIASEFRYSDPIVDETTLVVLISQSGETADTLAAMREARKRGAATLGIVNVVGSTLSREADGVFHTQAGPEIGVASTKAYLAQLVALALLTVYMAQDDAECAARCRHLISGLRALPDQIEQCLLDQEAIVSLAGLLTGHTAFFYLGRGFDYAASCEGALKLKEISYIHAEAYAAGEMKHGPLALVEPGVAVIGLCTDDTTHEKMVSNLKEVKAREGTVVAFVKAGLPEPDGADHVVRIPRAPEPLMPVLTMVHLQLLAYHIARLKGCEIDQPRNLAKSVTVE